MATEIDKRVVQMQFDNKEFEKNCKQSLTTLEKLKMALNFDGAKGLESMGKAAAKVDLSHLSKGADVVKVKFDALQVAGMTAIQELTRGLINFGRNIWANTFGQIKTGGWARSLKIDQANFQMKALAKNLDAVKQGTIDVTQYMKKMSDSIDRAVTDTAYGYDAAASVASQLMSSSITDVEKMYDHLRAIAGAASMTGSTFEDIGNIFTRVASNGRVMGDDLQSFSSRGLNLASTLAKAFNKTELEIRDMVSKGKVSFEDFSNALYDAFGEAAGKANETWSGVTSNVRAQLSRIGQLFTDPMVKSFIPVLAEVRARLKDVNKALQPVAKTWTKFIEYVANKSKNFLKVLKADAIKSVIHSIENVLVALIEIIWTIGRAVREVFPKEVQNEFKQGLRSLEMFTRTLIPSAETLYNFRQIVKAVLIPFKALWTIGVSVLRYAIGPLLKVFVTFVSVLMKVGKAFRPIIDALINFVTDGTFLSNVIQIIVESLITLSDILITILDCVIRVITTLTESGTFNLILNFLSITATLLGDVIVSALEIVFGLINMILSVINPSRIESFFSVIIDVLNIALGMLLSMYVTFVEWLDKISQGDTIFGKILQFLRETWALIKNLFQGNDISGNLTKLQGILDQLGEKIKAAWEKFKEFLHGMDAGKIIVYAFALSMVLLILSIRGFFNALTDAVKVVTGGIKDLVGIFSDIRGFLQGMIKISPALQVIIGVIGLLWSFTACFVILSDLEWDGIAKAGASLAIFGAGLLVMALVLSKIKFAGFGTAIQLLPSIMGLALAICASSAAIAILGKADISLKRLIPALISVALLLSLLGSAMALIQVTSAKISTFITKRMQAEEKRMMVSASVVIAFAAAVAILVFALIKVSDLPFDKAMKGLATVAGMMLALSLSMAIINWSGAKFGSALGIALFIGSFIILLKSIEALASLPFETMITGLKNAGSVLSMIAIFFTVTAIIGRTIAGNVMIHNITGMFTSLAILIGITTATIFLLKNMPAEAIAKGIGVVMLIATLFTAVAKHLLKSLNSFAGNMKTYKDVNILKSFSKFIATFSVCLIALVAATIIAKKIDLYDVFKLALIMTAFTAAIIVMEKFSAHTKRAKLGVIITFILGIATLFSMLAILTLADPDRLYSATLAIIGVLGVLTLLALAAGLTADKIEKAAKEGKESKFKNVALFATFVAGLIGVIAILIPLMEKAKDLDSGKMSEAAMVVGTVLVAFVVSIGVLAYAADKLKNADNIPKMVGPLIAVAASMILIVKAITDLVGYITSYEEGIYAMFAMVAVMLAFVTVIALFEELMKTFNDTGLSDKDIKALATAVLMMGVVYSIIAGSVVAIGYFMKDDTAMYSAFIGFLMLLSLFLVITEEFKSLVKAIGDDISSSDMLKVAASVVIMSSVLMIIAASVSGLAIAMNKIGALTIFGAWGMLILGFVMVTKALSELSKFIHEGKMTSTDMLKIASSVVIMSSVLLIIAGTITAMTLLISNSPAAILTSILAFAEIVGGFAILVYIFNDFLEESKGVDSKRMLAVAGVINIAAASLLIIAGAISMLTKAGSNPDSMAAMLAGWLFILSSFGVVCVALWKLGEKGDPGKMFSAAVSVVAASTAFLIISKALTALNDAKLDENFDKKLVALLAPIGVMAGYFIVMTLLADKVDPLKTMAAAASLAIGAMSLVILANSISKMVNAFKGVKDTEISHLTKIMRQVIALLGIITVLGIVGGSTGMIGAAAIAGIAALSGAFVIFATGVDILAKAATKFCDVILKMNDVKIDYHQLHRNLSNGLRAVSDAIVDAKPNMIEAMKSLFEVVLSAILAVVGTVVAIGSAFLMAFMEGILLALPEALNILTQIMKIIVDWLETPGNFNLIRSFFKDIGKLLVEVIVGVCEGIFDWLNNEVDKLVDKGIKAKEELAKERFDAAANEKMFNKAFNKTGIGPDNDMMYDLQTMKDQQDWLHRFEEGTAEYERAKEMFEAAKSRVFESLDKMTREDWLYTIDYLNQYAENVKNAGGVLDQEFLEEAQYLQHIAPMEFRDRFNDALLGIEPTVEEVENKVEELNTMIAAGPESDIYGNFEEQVIGAADATHDLKNETEFVNEELEKTGGAAVTLDTLKSKFMGATDAIKNGMKNVDIKGFAKKFKLDYTKLGATLGKITGISFGEEYVETRDVYEKKAMEKVYDHNGQWQYYYQAMGYESATAYVDGMMAGTDDGYTYAAKKLFEFLGINIDLEDSMEDLTDTSNLFGNSLAGIGDSADKAKSKLEEFRDGLKDSISNAMKGIFDEVKQQEYIDPEEMLYRMSENVRQVGEWARNIATLAARGMSEGLLNELKDMGPEGAAKVQAFVDMTDEQLQMANRRWKAAEFMPDYGTKEIENAYRNAGYNASLGFSNGIDPNAADTAATQLGTNSLNALMTELDEHSPSRKTEQMGVWATQGLANGLTNHESQAIIKMQSTAIANLLLNSIKNNLKPQSFQQLGSNVIQGFSNGLSANIPQILSKVTLFCSQLIATFQRVLRMHSPSKAMEDLGYNAMAGFGNGMEEGSEEVTDITDQSANDILNQMKANIAAVANGWSEDNVYQPVIRPVFDMDAISQGYSDIQSWFANSQGINLNGSISRLTPTTRDEDASTQQVIDAINRINNDDVVREISALRDDISQLQSAMTNLQVVMNTGALVGQLVEPIDRALGSKALYNSRGRY